MNTTYRLTAVLLHLRDYDMYSGAYVALFGYYVFPLDNPRRGPVDLAVHRLSLLNVRLYIGQLPEEVQWALEDAVILTIDY